MIIALNQSSKNSNLNFDLPSIKSGVEKESEPNLHDTKSEVFH